MAGDPDGRGTTTAPVSVVALAALLSALSYATESEGAFYPGPYRVFVVLVGIALVSGVVTSRSSKWVRPVVRDPLVAMTVALSLVTVASSASAGHATDAIGTVTLLLTMAAAVMVVRVLRPAELRLLTVGIVAVAVIVAVVGWAAVVAWWQPDALVSQGLWRAASTLTYENALAAFLTAPALLCLDRMMTAPKPSLPWSESAYLLLVGIGAAVSRGGVLGLVVGIALLGALRGPRTLLRLGAPAAGAVITMACLAPSVPVDSSPHVALAAAGLVFGAAVAAWSVVSVTLRIGAVAIGAAVLAALIAAVSTGRVISEIAKARASGSSSDRAHEWAAAFDVARHHLILGTGTARVLLQWDVGGKVFTATFAHNEYLQLLIQDGGVGLAVLVAGLVGLAIRLARLRGQPSAWSPECGIACLGALLVQSSLDFLWHIPVIPVLMFVVLAMATSAVAEPEGLGASVPHVALVPHVDG